MRDGKGTPPLGFIIRSRLVGVSGFTGARTEAVAGNGPERAVNNHSVGFSDVHAGRISRSGVVHVRRRSSRSMPTVTAIIAHARLTGYLRSRSAHLSAQDAAEVDVRGRHQHRQRTGNTEQAVPCSSCYQWTPPGHLASMRRARADRLRRDSPAHGAVSILRSPVKLPSSVKCSMFISGRSGREHEVAARWLLNTTISGPAVSARPTGKAHRWHVYLPRASHVHGGAGNTSAHAASVHARVNGTSGIVKLFTHLGVAAPVGANQAGVEGARFRASNRLIG